MNAFLSFTTKEFLHILRDGRTMLILLVMPVVLILLFGYAVTTEVKDTRVAVVDLSKDSHTARLTRRLAEHPRFTIAAAPSTPEEVDAGFRAGRWDMAVVFAPNFETQATRGGASLQLLIDGSEPNQGAVRLAYAHGVLLSPDESRMRPPVDIVAKWLCNPQGRSEYNFVPGVMGIILIIICAMMASVAIVREKERGTMEVLLASPLPPMVIILSKLVPYFVLSAINLSTILVLSFFLLDVPIVGSFGMLLVVCVLYISVSLALGLLISTLAETQLAAMMASLLLIVPTLYLSGIVFPIESMPPVLRWLSALVPARWFVSAARKLMIQGVETRHVWSESLAMAAMFAVVMFVALKNFKIRLQ